MFRCNRNVNDNVKWIVLNILSCIGEKDKLLLYLDAEKIFSREEKNFAYERLLYITHYFLLSWAPY